MGLRQARHVNDVFTMKVAWELCTKNDALWVQVIRAKYNCGELGFPVVNKARNDSNLWSVIKSVRDKFVTGCEGNVEDDELIWRDSDKGVLDIPSAYKMIANLDGRQSIPIFILVWRWEGYERWKIARRALPTNLAHWNRKMTLEFLCLLCNKEPESVMHCLRDSEEVR